MTLPAVADLRPGLIPVGFSETILERLGEVEGLDALYDAATSLAGLAHKWNGHGQEQAEIKAAQMFVEIELGQRLGPNPGAGGDRRSTDHQSSPYADLVPKQRIEEFRRYFGHRDLLVEAVRNGKRSRRQLLYTVDLAEAENRPAVSVDDLDIRRGDFRDVLADIQPGSVPLILTDPPYPAKYLALWSALGEWSAKALIDGGSLVAYSGQTHMPEVIDRLQEHLRYWWTLALLNGHGAQLIWDRGVSAGWKPLLWFVRDHRRTETFISDRVKGTAPRKTVPVGDSGDWAQGVDELAPIISALTAPDDLIVDPFAGSGTTGLAAIQFGRRFIGATL